MSSLVAILLLMSVMSSATAAKPRSTVERTLSSVALRFSSILPKWARRTKSLDALLPILYLRGVSTGATSAISRWCDRLDGFTWAKVPADTVLAAMRPEVKRPIAVNWPRS